MNKKWFVILGVLALVVVIACFVIGAGERIYMSSNGQRGWSLGASMYQTFGWSADAYRTDKTQRMQYRAGVQAPSTAKSGVETNSGATPDTSQYYGRGFGHGRFGMMGGRSGRVGWFLILLVILGVAGYFIYRHKKQKKTTGGEA